MTIETKLEQTNENTPANSAGIQLAPENIETSHPQESEKEINWKRFREARELDRKKREEAEREAAKKAQENDALRAALDSVINKAPSRNSEEQEETEDQKLERMIEQRLSDRDRKSAQERAAKEQAELPQRLASNYNDFGQVCSEENLDYLEYHYPEITSAFKNQPDSYDKWSNIYKTIKRFVPNPDSRKDQSKADKNFKKPQSMSVPGVTSTTDSAPMMLDEKRRQDNWSRMQRVMKGGR